MERSKLGRNREVQKLCIQEMLSCAQFLGGMTNWDRGGESDKENTAGEKEG